MNIKFFKGGITQDQKIAFAKAVALRIGISFGITGVLIGADQIVKKIRKDHRKEESVTLDFPFQVEVLLNATPEQISALFGTGTRTPYETTDSWLSTGKETTVTQVAENEYEVDSETFEKAFASMDADQRPRFLKSFYQIKVTRSPKYLFAVATGTPVVVKTDCDYTIVIVPK